MLENVIRSIPDWDKKSVGQLREYLVGTFTERTFSEPISWAGLIPAIGQDETALLRLKLAEWEAAEKDLSQKAFLGLVRWALDNTKLDLSLASNQAGIEQLRPALASIGIDADKIKAIGVWHEPEYERLGLSAEPTEEDIHVALDGILYDQEVIEANQRLETEKKKLLDAGSARWNEFVRAVDAWDGTEEAPVL